MPSLAQAEAKLAARCQKYLEIAGLSAAGPGPVAILADPIAEALAACGVDPADPSAPADADLRRLPDRLWFKFLDVAELRLLESCAGPLSSVTAQQWGDYRESMSVAPLADALKAKREAVRAKWGFGTSPLSAGTLSVGRRGRRNEF